MRRPDPPGWLTDPDRDRIGPGGVPAARPRPGLAAVGDPLTAAGWVPITDAAQLLGVARDQLEQLTAAGCAFATASQWSPEPPRAPDVFGAGWISSAGRSGSRSSSVSAAGQTRVVAAPTRQLRFGDRPVAVSSK